MGKTPRHKVLYFCLGVFVFAEQARLLPNLRFLFFLPSELGSYRFPTASFSIVRNPLTEMIFRAIRSELPHRDSQDEYIAYILPYIVRFTEHLHETEFYLEKRWLEVRDDENFHEQILHIFKPEMQPVEIKVHLEDQGAAYLYTVNGNVQKGTWSYLKANGLLLKVNNRYELYDLAFLSDDFFILNKQGDQGNSPQYLFLINERLGRNTTWRENMELLYDIYRYNLSFLFTVVLFLAFVGVIVFYSLR